MENKKLYKWTYLYNIIRHREQIYGYQKGESGGGRDKLEIWD